MEMKDGIKDYLTGRLNDYLFDELSEDYLRRSGIDSFMKGVPIPLKAGDLAKGEASSIMIARNMAFVLGCDPAFRYRDSYVAYIHHFFSEDFVKPLMNEGAEKARKNDFETACVFFRAALVLEPDNADALFLYARALHDAYENGEGEEYVGRFKAESLRAFERLTSLAPDLDAGWYYLGYAYLNMGLYRKASLAFQSFIDTTKDAELRADVTKMQDRLRDPIRIEEGCNDVSSGRFEAGIALLAPYTQDDRFNQWWPLWYHLGLACASIGDQEKAEACYQKALSFSPSNQEIMKRLVEVYQFMGRPDLVKKYEEKIRVVRHNAELDREQKRAESGLDVS